MCPATSLLPCNQIKLLRLWLVGPERNGWTQVNKKNWGKQPSRGALSWRGDVNLCHDCWGEKRHRLQHLELYTAGMTYRSTVSPVICSNKNFWGYQMFEVVKSTQRRCLTRHYPEFTSCCLQWKRRRRFWWQRHALRNSRGRSVNQNSDKANDLHDSG